MKNSPGNSRLEKREQEIAARLLRFRKGLGVTRTAFALKIGIGVDRLAAYEKARNPLKYFVFKRLAEEYGLSPRWLATGKGGPLFPVRFDDSPLADKITDASLFSTVYDELIANAEETRADSSSKFADRIIERLKALVHRSKDPSFVRAIPIETLETLEHHLDLMECDLRADIAFREKFKAKPSRKKKPS